MIPQDSLITKDVNGQIFRGGILEYFAESIDEFIEDACRNAPEMKTFFDTLDIENMPVEEVILEYLEKKYPANINFVHEEQMSGWRGFSIPNPATPLLQKMKEYINAEVESRPDVFFQSNAPEQDYYSMVDLLNYCEEAQYLLDPQHDAQVEKKIVELNNKFVTQEFIDRMNKYHERLNSPDGLAEDITPENIDHVWSVLDGLFEKRILESSNITTVNLILIAQRYELMDKVSKVIQKWEREEHPQQSNGGKS